MTIAFYLRLSHADGDLGADGKDESNSIENQRQLLRSYVRTKENLDGSLSKEAYLNVKEGLSVKIQDAEQQLFGIIEKHGKEKQISETAEHLGGLAKTFFGETELTYEIAQAFIQNVYIYNKEADGLFRQKAE